jgi:membrane protease YdiL (CAAX protease family)
MNENYNENLNQETFGVESDFTPEVFVPFFSPEEIAKRDEKKKIKKTANTIGIAFLLVNAFSFILSLGLSIANVVIYKTTGQLNFLTSPAINEVINIFFSLSVFGGIFTLVFKFAGFRISDLVSFKKTEKGLSLPLFFFGISFCAFANMASGVLDAFFRYFGIDYTVPDTEMPKGVFGFLLSLIATAIVPALLEEFALRGIVLGALRKFGDIFALIATSVCFGLMHSNFEQIPFAFLVGLFLGFSVIKTGSLRVAIGVHFYNNLISVIFNCLPDWIPNQAKNIGYAILLLLTLTIGIFMLSKTDKDFFNLKNSESVLTEKEKNKTFFLSGTILAFSIICLVESSLYIVL